MQEILIDVDVRCLWTGEPPAYRIYVDNDLLTERTFIWKYEEQCVREHIVVNLEPGNHSFQLIPVVPGTKGFFCTNFKINKEPVTLVNNQFTIQ